MKSNRIQTGLIVLIIIMHVPLSLWAQSKSEDPGEMILGKWQAEENEEFVWEFLDKGDHLTYEDDQLISERNWQIVNECEGETADNEYDFGMLEVDYGGIDDTQCYVIQGLNGVLTLLAIPQGRLIIFDRVVEEE